MTEIARIYLDGLVIPAGRLRKVDVHRVASLAQSMKALGLQQPISVWENPDHRGSDIRLVAGLHRVEAAKSLGWEQIDAILVALNETDRRLWEISENLHRAELTELERDTHLAEWIRLTEQMEAEKAAVQPKKAKLNSRQSDAKSKSDKNPKGAGRKPSGVRAASRELGVEPSDARRAIKVDSLTPEAKETAREVGLDDNRTALLKAAEALPERQSEVLRDIAEVKRSAPLKRAEATLTSVLMGDLETTATKIVERFGVKTGEEISDRFFNEFDWSDPVGAAQIQKVRSLLLGIANIYDAVVAKSEIQDGMSHMAS